MLGLFDAVIYPNNRFLTPGEILPIPREERLSRCREAINRAMRDEAYLNGKAYINLVPMAFPSDLRDELTAGLEAAGWHVEHGIGVVRIEGTPRPRRS